MRRLEAITGRERKRMRSFEAITGSGRKSMRRLAQLIEASNSTAR
jgi:hypothetical protein